MNTTIIKKNELLEEDIILDNISSKSLFSEDLANLFSETQTKIPEKFRLPVKSLCDLTFNINNPIEGYYIYGGFKQSPEIESLLKMYDSVENIDLKARILDLNWIFYRDHKKGKLASKILFETISNNYNIQRWDRILSRIQRCLQLNRPLNDNESNRKLLNFIVDRLKDEPNQENHFLIVNLIEILFKYNTIDNEIVKTFIKKALHFSKIKKYELSFKIYTILSKISQKNKNNLGKRKFQILAINSKLKTLRIQKKIPNQELFIASIYSEILELVSRVQNVKPLKDRILIEAKEAQKIAVSTFKSIPQIVDNKDIIKYLFKKFKRSDYLQCIFEFISLYAPPTMEAVKKSILNNLELHPLSQLVSEIRYDFRNKISSNTNHSSYNQKEKFHSQIIETYLLNQKFYAGSIIRNALILINKRIHIGYFEIEGLIELSPLIHSTQKKTATEAIHAGFNFDFGKFLQYSTPLYESILRNVLINLGQNVLIYDQKSGEQMEFTLSKLLDHELINKIFGENVIYDMKTLLDDSNGYKLRHIHAHGMLEDQFSYSDMSIYSFLLFTYLALKPVFFEERNGA